MTISTSTEFLPGRLYTEGMYFTGWYEKTVNAADGVGLFHDRMGRTFYGHLGRMRPVPPPAPERIVRSVLHLPATDDDLAAWSRIAGDTAMELVLLYGYDLADYPTVTTHRNSADFHAHLVANGRYQPCRAPLLADLRRSATFTSFTPWTNRRSQGGLLSRHWPS